ncbi:MAG: glycosyltransferase family 4 protein [Deltaproteobacteria bacterium]|nr:glycosyltransferase family 4 protein [Deltaproteobacteria bacterium]
MTGSAPLRILFLIAGTGRSGSGVSALTLAGGLHRAGHRVVVGCPAESFTARLCRRSGLETWDVDVRACGPWAAARRLLPRCRDEGIQVVNAQEARDKLPAVLLKLRGARVRAVLTRRTRPGTFGPGEFLLSNLLADLNIAVSEGVRRALLRKGVLPSRVRVIPNSVDLAAVDAVRPEQVAAARAAHAPDSPAVPVLGIVGRFEATDREHNKGYDVLLAALGRVRQPFRLLVLGPYKPEALARLGEMADASEVSRERISFCGFQEEILPFYRLMDIFVLPSTSEALSRSTLEAMASGCACLGSRIEGLRELITEGEDGLLFPARDARSLAACLDQLLADEALRRRLGQAARRTVETRFRLEQSVAAYETTYRELLGGHMPGSAPSRAVLP